MTDLTGFLDYLCDLGVVVSADGDRLKIEAPAGVLTDGLRADLTARKPAILDLLRRPRWRVDPDAPLLRIPLDTDAPPSVHLAERGLRSVAGDPATGLLFVIDLEGPA